MYGSTWEGASCRTPWRNDRKRLSLHVFLCVRVHALTGRYPLGCGGLRCSDLLGEHQSMRVNFCGTTNLLVKSGRLRKDLPEVQKTEAERENSSIFLWASEFTSKVSLYAWACCLPQCLVITSFEEGAAALAWSGVRTGTRKCV
ncbi:hypothetical protein TGMAS_415240 [Toxoplasma gondii MAS]|uniref:Uncharacterized protein n=1 Tax=Toxoplasma gondii MAS TaxID=943118 RepID=A0A086QCW1_TOXGO|nr:hypothetical protein TGMAS_415240 [Toxoplasma gondii MAS]